MQQNAPDQTKENCAVCSREFDLNDMISLENKWVCAECKPTFVQMLQEGISTADITVARHKRTLVMGKDATLPNRCVKCNAPAATNLKRNLYWHTPILYVLILFNLLIYAIIALIVRKRATVEIGVCDMHRSRRKTCLLLTWVIILLSAVLFIWGVTAEIAVLNAVGAVLFLGGLIFGALTTPLVTARKIDKEYVWLNGVCKDYLNTLPEWVKPD